MDENLYDDNDMQTEEPEEEETSSLTVEELRFLCDATRSADFMPKQMADALCRKLINMADPSEKKYFIKTERNGYIPAVKREDKFLNLITMELGSLEELEAEEINSSNWLTIGGFTPKPDFNL